MRCEKHLFFAADSFVACPACADEAELLTLREKVARLEQKDRCALATLSQVQDKWKDRCDDLQEALLALLGAPDYRTEYKCEHGTPLGQKCGIRGCHLNPVRFVLKRLPK